MDSTRSSLMDSAIAGLRWEPDSPFQVSKEDREALRFDRLAQVMVPPRKVVGARESWEISSKALADALFMVHEIFG